MPFSIIFLIDRLSLICFIWFLILTTLSPPVEGVFKLLKKKKFMEGFLVGFMVGNEFAAHKNGPKGMPMGLYPSPPLHSMTAPMEQVGSSEIDDPYYDMSSSAYAPSSSHHHHPSSYMRKKSDRHYRPRSSGVRGRSSKRKLSRGERLKNLIQFPIFVRKNSSYE